MKTFQLRSIKVLTLLILTTGFYYSFSQNNPATSKWEKSIAKFENQDVENPIETGAILFIGSSSFTIWQDVMDYFPGKKIINRGFGGSQTSDLWEFRDRLILPYKPSKVVIYVGENDIAANESAKGSAKEGIQLFEWILEKFPTATISYVSMKPSLKRWNLKDQMQKANKRYEKYARKNDRVSFINVWDAMLGDDGKPKKDIFLEDGLHMNKNGYAIWQKAFEPFM